MLYSDLMIALGDLLEYPIVAPTTINPSSDPSFNAIIPRMIDYAENRMRRDIDILAAIVTDSSGNLTPNNRLFPLPGNGAFLVVSQITPIINGVRQPTMTPVSREFIDSAWPADQAPSSPSVPYLFCRRDAASILVAPPPDANYPIEVVGTQPLTQLSPANPQNWFSLWVPDVYLAAAMIFMSGFNRDFSAQADDPKISQSWENQYGILLKGALTEELRKKFESSGNSSRAPSPIVGGVAP